MKNMEKTMKLRGKSIVLALSALVTLLFGLTGIAWSEPVNYNAGCIIPDKEYMKAMRELCTDHGIILIYDEILSAFRMGPDCAQGYLGITPDLCTIGKCVAGGTQLQT